MFNESNINCFLTLAETLSFKKTAFLMNVSQQAVSQVISRMETKLGLKLFIRSKRHVEITPIGQEFYEFFKRYKEEYDQLCVKARDMLVSTTGTIRIGYQNWIDYGVEPKLAMEELQREIPGLTTQVVRRSPGMLAQSLIDKEVDIGVMYDQFAPRLGELRITPLVGLDLEIFVAKDHPLAVPGADYRTFSEEPFVYDILENESEAVALRRIRGILDSFDLHPRELIVTHDLDAVYTAVERREGIALSSSTLRAMKSYNIKRYPTGRTGMLVCVSQLDGGNELIDKYVDALQRAYRKTRK